jgi:hypothetical protein
MAEGSILLTYRGPGHAGLGLILEQPSLPNGLAAPHQPSRFETSCFRKSRDCSSHLLGSAFREDVCFDCVRMVGHPETIPSGSFRVSGIVYGMSR